MNSTNFEDYKFYRHLMDKSWHVYVLKVPQISLFKGPYIGKYGEDDSPAYLGSLIDKTNNWEEASMKEKAFIDILRFAIKELLS